MDNNSCSSSLPVVTCLRWAALIVAGALFPTISSAQTFHFEFPLNVTLFDDCSNENVFVQGEIDITLDQSVDNAGGSHFHSHIVSKGKGIGLITLIHYTYSDEFEESFDIPGPPQTLAEELVVNDVLIAAGQTANSPNNE